MVENDLQVIEQELNGHGLTRNDNLPHKLEEQYYEFCSSPCNVDASVVDWLQKNADIDLGDFENCSMNDFVESEQIDCGQCRSLPSDSSIAESISNGFDDDDGDDDSDCCGRSSFCVDLAEWSTKFNISHSALSELLHILKKVNVDVPKDPRTLLGTLKVTDVSNVAGGSYFYAGVANSVSQIMSLLPDCIPDDVKVLTLHVNIDGLPLFNSSSVSLWPVLGMVKQLSSIPFLIAVYSGRNKPAAVDEYLKDFVVEMKTLTETGFAFNGRCYKIVLEAVICDAPARAFVKCIKGHCGYNACERCIQEGKYVDGRMTFPEIEAKERTDAEFASMLMEDHHTGVSPFTHLDIGCVSSFPLDYMHLVCLGVVRRTIIQWLKGSLKCRLSGNQVFLVSGRLCALRNHLPKEFCRKPRSLSEVNQWKATEFRQFLLYSGPIVLLGILPAQFYDNFLLLVVSLRILLSPSLCSNSENVDYVEKLLKLFVTTYSNIYGEKSIVYNVHSLIHLPGDARRYGALDNVSAFPFETFLGKLKKMVRRPQNPVAQIVRRVHEANHVNISSDKKRKPVSALKKPHLLGPLPANTDLNIVSQYSEYNSENLVVCCSRGNNCFDVNGGISLIRNICVDSVGAIHVVYQTFREVGPFFVAPLNSMVVGIFSVSGLAGELNMCELSNVGNKYVLLPLQETCVALSLLHL